MHLFSVDIYVTMKAQLVLFCFLAGAALGRVTYHGDQVLRIRPTTEDHLETLQSLDDVYQLDFWKPVRSAKVPVDVRVPAESVQSFKVTLRKLRIDYEVFIEDVQALIDTERTPHPEAKDLASFNYEIYHTFDEIQAWIDMVASAYPNLVTKSFVGTSTEGRDFSALTISSKPGNRQFVLNCGIHAREWVTPATCMFAVNQLLTLYGSDAEITSLVDQVDFVFIPSSNPDGYEYTWTNDRMWRKTRTRRSGTVCVGVDPNRNWDADFTGSGSSTSPCSDTYRGPYPFSEPCTLAQKNFVESLPNPRMYVDVHSYSQLWMYSYGYTTQSPSNAAVMSKIADDSVAAIRSVHGKIYEPGQISTTIYIASGSTADYFYDNVTPCSFATELRDTGRYGFLLPENQIKPTAEESLAAFKVMAQAVIDNQCESR